MVAQRVLFVSIFSGVGAMMYALYDAGIVLSKLTIPLGILQQMLCIGINVVILGLIGIVVSLPLALLPIQKNNENWVGFIIGYTISYAFSGFFSETIISTYWIALVAFILFVIGIVIFSIYRELEERIKMGSVLFVSFASVGGMAGYVPHKPQYGTALDNAPNVLVIAVDSLRFDHIASNGHPVVNTDGIDELLATGVSIDNAFAQSPMLLDFYDQLIYGKQPWEVSSEEKNIGNHFRKIGYRTGFFTSTEELKGRYKKGFDVYDDDFAWIQGISGSFGGKILNELFPFISSERLAEHSTQNLLRWITTESKRPFFALLQFSDPSWPFEPPAPWSEDYYSGNPRSTSEKSLLEINISERQKADIQGITDLNFVMAQYTGEVAYVSKQIEALLEVLETSGLRENTCIVFLSSNGISLGEQQQWFSTQESTDVNLFRVPLIFSFPKIVPKGERRSAVLELSDVTPTIFELLVQDNFSSNGQGMANALYGGTGREYARSIVQKNDKSIPILWLTKEQKVWRDTEGRLQSSDGIVTENYIEAMEWLQ